MVDDPFVRKKVGRFFKNGDDLLATMEVTGFDFDKISESEMLYFDNLKQSLISKELHDPKSLEESIRKHASFDKELREPHQFAPKLVPIDFTADWRKEQERNSQRNRARMDEEEAYELELEFKRRSEEIKDKVGDDDVGDEKKQVPDEPQEENSRNADVLAQADQSDEQPEITSDEKDSKDPFTIQKDSLDSVGEVINRVALTQDEPSQQDELNSQLAKQEQLLASPLPTQEPAMSENPLPNPDDSPEPIQESILTSNSEPFSQDSAEEFYAEYKSQGYEDGYKDGEEKALVSMQSETKESFNKVGDLVDELSQLKRNILQNVETHFVEIAQAIAESLLGREFRINPAALASVINKAIQENVKDDDIKIHVNSKSFDLLSQCDLGELQQKIVVDENLKEGDFRVESELSSVDGTMKKLVSDMLSGIQVDFSSDMNTEENTSGSKQANSEDPQNDSSEPEGVDEKIPSAS